MPALQYARQLTKTDSFEEFQTVPARTQAEEQSIPVLVLFQPLRLIIVTEFAFTFIELVKVK